MDPSYEGNVNHSAVLYRRLRVLDIQNWTLVIADRELSCIENRFGEDLKERHATLSVAEPHRADDQFWLVHQKHCRSQIARISDENSIDRDFREGLHAKQADLIFYGEKALFIPLKWHGRLDYLDLRVIPELVSAPF